MDFPREVVIRKSIHLLFTLTLLIPFTPIFNLFLSNAISILQYYLIMAVASSILNAVKVKNPIIGSEILHRIKSFRKKMLNDLYNIKMMKPSPWSTSIIEKLELMGNFIEKFEEGINNQLNMVERRYERIGGYIGISAGIIGVLFSYIFFKKYVIYGIYALIVVDPVGAIVGKMFGKRRIKWSNASLEGSTSEFLAYAFLLYLLGFKPHIAILSSLITTLAEIYGIEDNLFIPIAASGSLYFLLSTEI